MKNTRNLRIGLSVLGGILILLAGLWSLGSLTARAARAPEEAAINGALFPDSISAGAYHTCMIKSDGSLACWGAGTDDVDGDNRFGQAMPPAGTFLQISAGDYHTCGLKSDGTVVCWGAGSLEDVDSSESVHAGQSIVPDTYDAFVQVTAGGRHSCALLPDGTPTCWGSDVYGQSTPVAGNYRQISAGGSHTCAIRDNGEVVCWGAGTTDGVTKPNYGQAIPPAGIFLQISAGGYHTCGLRDDGTVTCWGAGDELETDEEIFDYQQSLLPEGTFTSISAGFLHNCGLHSDGKLACWGAGTTVSMDNPEYGQSLPQDYVYSRVAAGGYHTCGMKSDGSLACWGGEPNPYYDSADHPLGTYIQRRVSTGAGHYCLLSENGNLACFEDNTDGQAAPPTGTFTEVSTGVRHSCALASTGELRCWGNNDSGQLDHPEGSFIQLSAGDYHNCALSKDGTLACWGADDFDQSDPPAGKFRQVSAGGLHSCGVKADGSLACWGSNSAGQSNLQIGTFRQVSAGGSHTCAIGSNGKLSCWGDGSAQQIPSEATGTYTQVSAGYQHTCAIKINGELQCWGSDEYLQELKNSDIFLSQVSAGHTSTCGITSLGALFCWGDFSFTTQELTISPATLPAAGVGMAYEQALTAQGGTPPYLYGVVIGSLPQGLTLNSNGLLSGVPLTSGLYSFTVQATDASLPVLIGRKTYQLQVVEVVAADDAYHTSPGSVLRVVAPGVLANDSSQIEGSLSAVLVGDVAHGSLDFEADGSFAYTPEAGFSGQDGFTYRATVDEFTSNLATVTIQVVDVYAVDDDYGMLSGDVLRVAAPGVLANDSSQIEGSLSAALVGDVTHGSLDFNPDGSFVYTPDANFVGQDRFTYQAKIGDLESNLATVTILVVDVIAEDDAYRAQLGDILRVGAPGVLANDRTLMDGSLSAVLASGVSHGTLDLKPDGSFEYLPEAGYSGQDSFTYQAMLNGVLSNLATVQIDISNLVYLPALMR
jgi:alpha-tubulin suppressor-like RCC1 family protein